MLIPSEGASSGPIGANVKPVLKGQPVRPGDHELISCTGLRTGMGLVVTPFGGHFSSYQLAGMALGLRKQGVGSQTNSGSALLLGLRAS